LIDKIFPVAMTLGACLDPNSAWLTLRGMKTYALRTRQASNNALDIAEWLEKQPWAENIKYPALPTHPDHEIWKKQNNGDGGAVVTFDLKCRENRVDRFFDELKLFIVTPSLGCVESLAAPCLLFFADDLPEAEAHKAGINKTTVRLAIGIESAADLKSDLEQAAQSAISEGV
jgi:cystathionine gamma-lyase